MVNGAILMFLAIFGIALFDTIKRIKQKGEL